MIKSFEAEVTNIRPAGRILLAKQLLQPANQFENHSCLTHHNVVPPTYSAATTKVAHDRKRVRHPCFKAKLDY